MMLFLLLAAQPKTGALVVLGGVVLAVVARRQARCRK